MLIADGAIRSGKTISCIDSFVTWSLSSFENETFIIAGRSMGALKRNVLQPLFQILAAKGLGYQYNRSENFFVVGSNTYYCFGASNEASQDVLQGLTAAGAYADEVALFPKSFVEQMIGRCSVDGAKIFANCNPQGPKHWFKEQYIDKANEKKILYLHFTINDNLTLAERVKERYRRMFTGVFYKRFIQGLWVMAEGLIFDMFSEEDNVVKEHPKILQHWVTIDYGTANPTVFLLLGLGNDNNIYVIDEWRWDSKAKGRQKTDKEYSQALSVWLRSHKLIPSYIFVDPSAKSFILQLNKDGFKKIVQADNSVQDGIRVVSSMFGANHLYVHKRCDGLIKELYAYVWDEKAQERGEDKPMKVDDHGPDALRYGIYSRPSVWRNILKEAG
ncbi:PBSX family phage terminase large subunit [Geomicrobium sp. JCM 19037]|uniref:PBSX family phage terminase large subunit n=1 Tax=Geomicrobium sp. JCM 19037 TaxID=1460634 RepID=UPI001EE674FC|nr:PBSX family phage terminase large subunit [Geomicrobium sp. JCM 19037]